MTRSTPSARRFAAGPSREARLWPCLCCWPATTTSSCEPQRQTATSIFSAGTSSHKGRRSRRLHLRASHRRNRCEHADQNGQHQKTTEENRHLAHRASNISKVRCTAATAAQLAVIVGLELIALQRQKALKNTDQMKQMEPTNP